MLFYATNDTALYESAILTRSKILCSRNFNILLFEASSIRDLENNNNNNNEFVKVKGSSLSLVNFILLFSSSNITYQTTYPFLLSSFFVN